VRALLLHLGRLKLTPRRYHPDKNPDDVEGANERFRLISAAHEVLCDAQERAWYDGHRESILRGELDDDDEGGEGAADAGWDETQFAAFRAGTAQAQAPGSSSAGLTPRHILRFLDPTLILSLPTTGHKADDDAGFYGTFRRLFERIAAEDAAAAPYAGEAPAEQLAFPSFGYSHTPWLHAKGEAPQLGQTQMRDFYQAWAGYSTRKAFGWKDRWKLSDAPDRRVKR
jgi:DnaJ family protein A protein 5